MRAVPRPVCQKLLTDRSRHRAQTVQFPRFLETGITQDERYEVVTKAGKVIPVQVSGVAQRNRVREIVGGIAVLTVCD